MGDSGDIRYEKLNPERVNELKAISLETFTQSFFHLNTRGNFVAYVSEAFSEEILKQELSAPGTWFYFIYFQNQLAGYFKINFQASPGPETDMHSMELQRIYVLNKYQGSGIGSRALEFVLDMAKSANCKSIWLGVWEHNIKAIRFYENHGFIKPGFSIRNR